MNLKFFSKICKKKTTLFDFFFDLTFLIIIIFTHYTLTQALSKSFVDAQTNVKKKLILYNLTKKTER